VRPRIAELTVPTLFILADPSALVPPSEAEKIRAQLGNQSVVNIPNTTHSVYRDDFEGFLREVDAFMRSPAA
jgi:pimeloyl-ACP methyl ester carboxylesterase